MRVLLHWVCFSANDGQIGSALLSTIERDVAAGSPPSTRERHELSTGPINFKGCNLCAKKQHLNYPQYSGEFRNAVVAEYPRTPNFKDDIIQALCDAIHKKPETTFGNVKADVHSQTRIPSSFWQLLQRHPPVLAGSPERAHRARDITEARKEL